MIYLVVIINIILCYRICTNLLPEETVAEKTAITFSLFMVIYVICSGFLFVGDVFSFRNVILMQCLILIFSALFQKLKCRTRRQDGLHIGEDKILFIILAIALFFSLQKFELFSMEQDQGVYQIEAIQIACGNYKVQHDFEEYQLLESGEDKEQYKFMVDRIYSGFYPLKNADFPTVNPNHILSDVSGVYHGVHTFSAWLALTGRLFGIENMMHIQTVGYLCSIILIYYTLKNLSAKKINQIILTLIYALSPLLIWISKSALTEMPLTILISLYLYFLTKKQIPKYLLGIPLLGFAFLHVSFLQILPIFIIVHLYLYCKKKDIGYLTANIIAASSLFIGNVVMAITAPHYFYQNVARIFYKNIINKNNYLLWMFLIAILIIVASMLVLVFERKGVWEKYELYCEKLIEYGCKASIVGSIVLILYYLYRIGYTYTPQDTTMPEFLVQYYGTGINAVGHLSIVALMFATGGILIPLYVYHILFKYQYISTTTEKVIMLFLIYTTFLSSALLRKEVYYYYYYSRYLVFYLPVIIIFGNSIFNKISLKKFAVCGVVSLACILPFSIVLCFSNDDTYVEWETLFDLKECIMPNSAVIIENISLNRSLGLPLKAVTMCDVFPLFNDKEAENELLWKNYDNVYYLSSKNPALELGIIDSKLSTIEYRDHYKSEKNPIDSMQGHYPLIIPENQHEIILYRLGKNIDISIESIGKNMDLIKMDGNSDSIQSNGMGGVVAYGPYITLPEGKYMVNINVDLISSEVDDIGYFSIYNEQGNNMIVDKIPLKNFKDNKKINIRVEFTLDKELAGVEFVIEELDGTILQIYPYSLQLLK